MKIAPAASSARNRLSERDMMTNGWMKLRFVSLSPMLLLAAALATRAASEEAAPQPPGDAKAANSPAHSPDAVPSGDNSTPAPGRATADDVDTRITVQPHGPSSGKPGRLGGATSPVVPLKLINPHRRTFSPSRASNRLLPNASGVRGPQRQNVQQTLGDRFQYKGFGQRPSIGVPEGVAGGIAVGKPETTFGRQSAVPSTSISPIGAGSKSVIHGGIGGTSFNHHALGSGIAGIGGPARTVTGINGTSIREKR
jgi:hypothetical protein